MLLDYLEGNRPDYSQAELKIINPKPLTVSDDFGHYIRLSLLEEKVAEKLTNLNRRHRDRHFSLCLNNWRFVLKKVPGCEEFTYDILCYDFE